MIGLVLVIVVVALPFIAGLGLLVWGLATTGRAEGFAGWLAAVCGVAVFALWVLAFIVNRALLAVDRALLHMPQFDVSLLAQRALYIVAYSPFLALGLVLILLPARVTTVLTRLLPRRISARVGDEASSNRMSRCLKLLGMWSILTFVLLVVGVFGVLFLA